MFILHLSTHWVHPYRAFSQLTITKRGGDGGDGGDGGWIWAVAFDQIFFIFTIYRYYMMNMPCLYRMDGLYRMYRISFLYYSKRYRQAHVATTRRKKRERKKHEKKKRKKEKSQQTHVIGESTWSSDMYERVRRRWMWD